MKEKFKLGIIGMGSIGNVHADSFRSVDGVELSAICDIDEKKLAASGKRLGLKDCFIDYRDLLKTDVQAVVIGVSNRSHCEIAVAALEAGKDVLLEKPMAMNADEGAQIEAAAAKTKRALQIGMVWRQDASAQVVRDYIQRGEFGSIYHIRAVLLRHRGIPGLGGWFTTKSESGGGPIIDLGVHWFDLGMWVSGLWEPTSVSAKTYSVFGPRMSEYRHVDMWAGPAKLDGAFDVEDYAAGLVRFGSKATMSFELSWAGNLPDMAFIDILGDKGGARLVDGKPLQIYTEQNDRPVIISPLFKSEPNTSVAQARSFIAACRGEAQPFATAGEGVTIMRLLDAVYKSCKNNEEVPIV